MTIYVYQTDNRPKLDYLKKTMKVNMYYSKINKYKYIFEEMNIEGNFHPALYKIFMVNKLLSKNIFNDNDILIFLDSDAWIFNPEMLKKLLNEFPLSKHGIFSRDPYVQKNTYINSGSFIIRINKFTKNMYSTLENQARENPKINWNKINHSMTEKAHADNIGGPLDQWYVSNYVYKNRNNFIIYKPDITNTPVGKIIRHSWIKDFSTCYIKKKHKLFNLEKYIDKKSFPNKLIEGYEYFEPIKKQKINKIINKINNVIQNIIKPKIIITTITVASCLFVVWYNYFIN